MIITGEARLLEREIFQGRPQELPELPRRELVDAEPYAANYEILKNEPNGVETVHHAFLPSTCPTSESAWEAAEAAARAHIDKELPALA